MRCTTLWICCLLLLLISRLSGLTLPPTLHPVVSTVGPSGILLTTSTGAYMPNGLLVKHLASSGKAIIEPSGDWCDLRYRNVTIEVKASGLSQTWNLEQQSTPRFDIRPRKMAWDADSDQWRTFDPPRRPTDIYVFCLHEAIPATIKDVQDPLWWTFWVIPTRLLDEELGGQKNVGVGTLNRLTRPVEWKAIPAVLSSLNDGD